MASGTLRYWAAARAAAGVDEETIEASTLAAAVEAAVDAHPDQPRLAAVLGICAFVVDGAPVGTRAHDTIELRGGWVAEALPPFAGG
jgi:molybdopterin synthase sulfur carrier subunit